MINRERFSASITPIRQTSPARLFHDQQQHLHRGLPFRRVMIGLWKRGDGSAPPKGGLVEADASGTLRWFVGYSFGVAERRQNAKSPHF